MTTWTAAEGQAGENYLLLADLSGYTAFLAGVEREHGLDFSDGIPAGYGILAALLDVVVEGVQPDFAIEELEGDAVFAVAPASTLDGRGSAVVEDLQGVHEAFREQRAAQARIASDHICTACPVASKLDLKMILHRGTAVRQTVGARNQLLGPAVNVAHRLLKNTISARVGYRPYLFVTDKAAVPLGLVGAGIEHQESYEDVGAIDGRILEFVEREPRP